MAWCGYCGVWRGLGFGGCGVIVLESGIAMGVLQYGMVC